MKFAALVLIAFVGAANASLQDDFQDFLDLIPLSEIKDLTVEYAKHDAEFQIALAYLRGPEFHEILSAVRNTGEWRDFVAYLDDCGLDIYRLIEKIYDLLDVHTNFNAPRAARIQPRSFHGWLNAVRELIPTKELAALAREKLHTSSDFQAFWARLRGNDFQAVVAAVVANEEWQALLQKGRDHGAPIDVWIKLIRDFFGWE